MDTTPYQEFAESKLGFQFNDINLLVTALTHRSYVNEHKKSTHDHNERLEFLGDAVLELVSSDFLFRNYNEPEGATKKSIPATHTATAVQKRSFREFTALFPSLTFTPALVFSSRPSTLSTSSTTTSRRADLRALPTFL